MRLYSAKQDFHGAGDPESVLLYGVGAMFSFCGYSVFDRRAGADETGVQLGIRYCGYLSGLSGAGNLLTKKADEIG